MATHRTYTRAALAARTETLGQLKDDHKRVKQAYREFQKLDGTPDPQARQTLVQKVLDELTVHAALEEELLYPAARSALANQDLIDEAEVEHESLHVLIDQIRAGGPDDDKYAARFTVLCEYVLHHVKEEEGEVFPQLEKARLEWESLAAEMAARRSQLTATHGGDGSSESVSASVSRSSNSGHADGSAGRARRPRLGAGTSTPADTGARQRRA